MSGAKPTKEQMEAARKVVSEASCARCEDQGYPHSGTCWTPKRAILCVAQAIADAVVEERERCARIADQAALRQWSTTTTQTAEAISKLIRKGIGK